MYVIRRSFTCPNCHAALLANTTRPIIFAWLTWSLMDFALQSIIYLHLGYTWWPGITLRIVASVAVGIVLVWAIFSVFVKVRAAPH